VTQTDLLHHRNLFFEVNTYLSSIPRYSTVDYRFEKNAEGELQHSELQNIKPGKIAQVSLAFQNFKILTTQHPPLPMREEFPPQ